MLAYDQILQDHEATLENAIDMALGLDWQTVEVVEIPDDIVTAYVDTYNGVDIYYSGVGDYYVFVPETEEEYGTESVYPVWDF